jgi:hypothetical protein
MADGITEEKRIYVVVPETIQTNVGYPLGGAIFKGIQNVQMVPGRLMAQCAHVVSKMCWLMDDPMKEWEAITTIVLAVRNTRELQKTFHELLLRTRDGEVVPFFDTNLEVYGTETPQFTTFCTTPVIKSDVDAALGHLELYGA